MFACLKRVKGESKPGVFQMSSETRYIILLTYHDNLIIQPIFPLLDALGGS